MCNKEQLVSYLYEDLNDMDRAKLDMHLRTCETCRDELNALRGVRVDLATWAPPLPDLGFRLVRDARDAKAAPTAVAGWRAWWTPAAGLAAAAVLVLAAASALAHIEVHRGPDGITVRTGWSTALAIARPAARDVQLAAASSAVDPAALQEIERRINTLETALRNAPQVRNASTLSARASDAEMIRRVHDMLAQSETKQQSELALRIAQVIRDFDAQRNSDLVRIQQGLGRIDAITTAEATAHRELTNYIMASAKQK